MNYQNRSTDEIFRNDIVPDITNRGSIFSDDVLKAEPVEDILDEPHPVDQLSMNYPVESVLPSPLMNTNYVCDSISTVPPSKSESSKHTILSRDNDNKEKVNLSQKLLKDIDVQSVMNTSPGLSLISQLESTEESDTDSSSDSSDNSAGQVSDAELVEKEERSVVDTIPKVKGEVDYRDLPSEETCDIPFPPNGKVLPIGKVSHYTEKLLVIEAFPDTPAVNEGTVLWREDKTSIARIFEIFGPVKTPFYSVLVPSKEYAKKLGLESGDTVYVVPGDMSVTTYVFTSKLLEEKGCDASWKNDVEIPEEYQEFSDDEAESLKKQKKRKPGMKSEPKTKKGQSANQNTGNHFSNPAISSQRGVHQTSRVCTYPPPMPPTHMGPYIPPGMYPPSPHTYSRLYQDQMYPYPPPAPPGYYSWPRYPPP